ncbi:MAG: hypothetical protein K2L24_00530 [Opitutales bacterium]|nr:hypothetical protein [Opitutales bacterium]
MISSLGRILQKRWLFGLLLVAVVVSFVFTVGSSPGIGRGRQWHQKFCGIDLGSRQTLSQWQRETELSTQLRQIFLWLPQMREFALFTRLVELKLADQLGIPEPNKTQIEQFVERYPAFQDAQGKFDANRYNDCIEEFSRDAFQQGILEQTVRNDYRCAAVENLLMGRGVALPAEARYLLSIENQRYDGAIARFQIPENLETIAVDGAKLKEYFEQHREDYKLSEQIVLDYVVFSNEQFLADLPTPSKETFKAFYQEHASEFTGMKEGSEELKQAIVKSYQNQETRQRAMHAADQFVYELYAKNIAPHSLEFTQLLEQNGLKIQSLDPVALDQLGDHKQFSAAVLSQCSQLNADDRYYSDPVLDNQQQVCVLFFRDIVPSLYSPFESVRDRVINDYRHSEAKTQLSEKIESLHQSWIANGLSLEKFQSDTKENDGTIEVFEQKKRSKLKLSQEEQEALQLLHNGEVSSILKTDDGAYEVVFLAQKLTPPAADAKAVTAKLTELEEVDGESYSECLLEIILQELGVKGAPSVDAQYRMIASLYFSQALRKRNAPFSF